MKQTMQIRYGLISCDSHAQLDRDAFLKRMSKKKWGDAIPQVVETSQPAHTAGPVEGTVERWLVHGQIVEDRGVCHCPKVMDDPTRKAFPQRWEAVPRHVYDPEARLWALDQDGIDAEVLFPNDPLHDGTFFQGDAAFERDCVRAYNDALAEWREVSERYIPLAIIPYMGGIEATVAEMERAVRQGHQGIVMLAEPSHTHKGLKHFNDPYWEPLWAACQDLDVPIHWHANAGLHHLTMPRWKGYTRHELHAMAPAGSLSLPAQFIPNLLFSGIPTRYPGLKWVCAETGLGWTLYILEGCDHEWERRHLWTEGLTMRPSELFRRQIYINFWFEEAGIQLRHVIGLDHILWESDYPHSTSTYPESWTFINRSLAGVPQDERDQMLYRNALRLYNLDAPSDCPSGAGTLVSPDLSHPRSSAEERGRGSE